ncbi:MAG: DNA replication/repair protein RecF [Candidatus Woykebacteria bacterium]
MWIENLEISDFRNFKNLKISFGDKINLFVGDNAQGKTNIIEAVHLLSTTKSFRAGKDLELINWGSEHALLAGTVGPHKIKTIVTREGKRVFLDNNENKKQRIIGLFPIVLFSPESIEVVSGPPDRRRRFLDQVLSVTDKTYLYHLARFGQVMKRRNKLLWLEREGFPQDFSVWDRQLVDSGNLVWKARISFYHYANNLLKKIGRGLSGSEIRINYRPFAEAVVKDEEIGDFFAQNLAKRKKIDVERGLTSFGPHRDDFRVLLEIFKDNEILEEDIGTFGSRGEQRIATLALKLVETNYIEKVRGEKPTLLLDDILSEFDKNNREHILEVVYRQQSIITATSKEFFPNKVLERAKIYSVKDGGVSEVKR